MILMEKSALPGEGGDAYLPPFTISTITYKFVVCAAAERADKLRLFRLYPYMHCGPLPLHNISFSIFHP